MLFGIGSREPSRSIGAVAALAIGIGGIACAITLLFLGMRAVMDVGGMCAEGGPYEIATTCPEGSTTATLLGVFGLFGFGGLTLWAGSRVGGPWVAAAGLAWVALFAVLGWNFLEYGIMSPPEGETVVWGWLIPGVLFEAMAFGPVVLALGGLRSLFRTGALPDDWAAVLGVGRPQGGGGPRPRADRSRSREDGPRPTARTDALLDRLEQLAELRERGLLDADEYETAKAAVIRELEGLS